MNDIEYDPYTECNICGSCYNQEFFCDTCYMENAPYNEWLKIEENFDLPSHKPFLIYTPHYKTNILIVNFCQSDRKDCKKLHLEMVEAMGMGKKEYVDIKIKDCTHWMRLPKRPEKQK